MLSKLYDYLSSKVGIKNINKALCERYDKLPSEKKLNEVAFSVQVAIGDTGPIAVHGPKLFTISAALNYAQQFAYVTRKCPVSIVLYFDNRADAYRSLELADITDYLIKREGF